MGAGVLVTVAAQVTSPPAVLGILVLAFAVLTRYLSVNGIAKAEVFPGRSALSRVRISYYDKEYG